jgi:hypothetical protein
MQLISIVLVYLDISPAIGDKFEPEVEVLHAVKAMGPILGEGRKEDNA